MLDVDNINIRTEKAEVLKENIEETAGADTRRGAINWSNLSRYLILALTLLLPFWIFPFGGNALGMSKSLLIFALVLMASIFYLIHLLQEGSIRYPRTIMLFGVCAILLIGLISSFFSDAVSLSFFGTGGEVGTFFFLFILFILFFLTILLFQSERKALLFFSLLILSSIIVFICEAFHIIFGLTFWNLLPGKIDSLVGSRNELAIFFGFIALLSVVFLEFFEAKRSWRLFLFFILGMSLLTMILVNFTTAWVVFGTLTLVLFVYLFSSFRGARNFARLSLFILLIALFFILARPLVGDLVNSMGLNSLEVRPSWGATFTVVKDTLGVGIKNAMIGSGPNTFIYDWIKFKPLDINQTLFWNVRFQNGIGLLPSFIVSTGILGGIAWLFFLAMILYYGLRAINYSDNDVTRSLLLGSFLASVYLWIFNIIYVPSNFLFALSFLVTGLFFALLIKSNRLPMTEFSFIGKTSLGFISSLAIVLLLIVSVAASYMFFQKYWAFYSYNKGIVEFNVSGDIDKVQEFFLRAVRFDKQDRYYRALSELGLVRLAQLSTQQLPQEEARMQFQNILAFVIQHAQTATKLNSADPLNWMGLGQVYQSFIPFQIEGAKEAAIDSYAKALEKSPKDPRPLLAAAQAEVQSDNNEEAKSFLKSALELKGNYTSALFLLAQIAAQEGDLEAAIQQTELAQLTAPNDIGILFQLGLLYYQNKDYKNAQLALERAVIINPNYSNARYFLGLAYDNDNQNEKAIDQFEIIQSLNPDNVEVERILNNLKRGRSALSSISPPEPAPEEREEPPIDEEE